MSLGVAVEHPLGSMLALPGLKVAHVPVPLTATPRGLMLWVNDDPGRMHLQLMSPADAYSVETQEAFLDSICEAVLSAARS
jgi:hypothetical protein